MTRIAEILAEAQEILDTARVGLDQAKMGPYHVKAGFRNVAIFGKMVTFCTNNLRGKLTNFEEWDQSAKKKYFDNAVAKAMGVARNQFEKQATSPIFSSTYIESFSSQDLASLPKPLNAVEFFIGDRAGGSGWMLQMENGDRIPYYIDFPPHIGEVNTVLTQGGETFDLLQASEKYLTALGNYLEELRAFAAESGA